MRQKQGARRVLSARPAFWLLRMVLCRAPFVRLVNMATAARPVRMVFSGEAMILLSCTAKHVQMAHFNLKQAWHRACRARLASLRHKAAAHTARTAASADSRSTHQAVAVSAAQLVSRRNRPEVQHARYARPGNTEMDAWTVKRGHFDGMGQGTCYIARGADQGFISHQWARPIASGACRAVAVGFRKRITQEWLRLRRRST